MYKAKLYSAFLILGLSISNLNSQAWVWATGVGGSSYDIANDIYTDASGNSYVTGWFQNTVNFGPSTLTSVGGYDFYVAKYNSAGICLWAQGTGSTMNDAGYGVIADASGNVFVTGAVQGVSMFGSTTITSLGAQDVFVAKYNSSGVCQWASSGGSTLDDQGQAIALDAAGNIIVNGYFKGAATFGTINISAFGNSDALTAKLNSLGVWQWVQKGGGTSGDNGYGVTTDANNNIYVTGYFRNTATFGIFPLSSFGTDDAYIVKYNSAGVCQWAEKAGGTGDDHGNGIVSDAAGNTYVTGWFKSPTMNIGTLSINNPNTNEEVFVAKYSTSGGAQWAVNVGSTSFEIGTGICLDNTSNPVISLSYQASFTVGTTPIPSYGGQDIVIAKFNNANGTNIWAVSAGGSASDYAFKVSADGAGNIYTAGNFNGTCNFGTNPVTSVGIADIFVAKIDPVLSGIGAQENNSEIILYPNPVRENESVNANLSGEIKIYNAIGEEVFNQQISKSSNLQINLPAGIYFYQIVTEQKKVTGKLIVQ